MSPPTVRINTFVQPTVRPLVDSITKVYIIGELLLGVSRLPVITEKRVYIIPGLIYSGLTLCGILYILITHNYNHILDVIININVLMYIVCIIFSYVFCKRMHRFYNELNNFDTEVGCRPKFVRGSIKNLIQACVMIIYILILFLLPYQLKTFPKLAIHLIPTHITQTFEVHYYGHLLNLLTPRLRLINHYMEKSVTKEKDTKKSVCNELIFFKNHDYKANCEMKKIMELYYIIVKSYNYLIEAIKWKVKYLRKFLYLHNFYIRHYYYHNVTQLLFIIISSFITVLGISYHFSLIIIRPAGEYPLYHHLINDFSLGLIIMMPLFAPCVFADRVHDEVRRLRELLASRLYENKMDKPSRRYARTLLAYTETRDLSFVLFRILNIDISLPFKFVGLLATYLIILLQFEKVLNI